MPDWEGLHHLAALVRAGTVAGAARALKVEHATVVRRIASLESELQLKLLDRRGRKIELTRHGRELVASLERMQAEVEAIERITAGSRTTLSGEVTISAPPALAAEMLGPPLVDLRSAQPGLTLHVVAETRQSALQRREADIAIRLGAPIERDLTATKLGEVSFRLYASPDYLASTPEDEWVFVAYDASMDRAPQQIAMARIAQGRPVVIRSNSAELQVSLIREGGGVAMLPEFMTRGQSLVPAGGQVIRREVWLVIHSDMTGSAPVRAVADAIRDALSQRFKQ